MAFLLRFPFISRISLATRLLLTNLTSSSSVMIDDSIQSLMRFFFCWRSTFVSIPQSAKVYSNRFFSSGLLWKEYMEGQSSSVSYSAISFCAVLASQRSSRNLVTSARLLGRFEILAKKRLNMRCAFEVRSLKSRGVRRRGIIIRPPCQAKYRTYLGSSDAAFCQGKHPVKHTKITMPNCQTSWLGSALEQRVRLLTWNVRFLKPTHL